MEPVTERLILVVEENPDHAQLIQAILQADEEPHQLMIVADETEAIEFLQGHGKYSNASRPDLILLNLNRAETSSSLKEQKILADIKANPQLRRIPIIVLTTSDDEADIFSSYALQGNCYVIKSTDLNQLSALIKRIKAFWLGIVTLPLE
ncbi:MAG TPA: response regulator [Trichocoleus sp.]|jgi:chemotaxis family two-component system response regulator Rcp1